MAATRFPTPKNGIFLADWERKRERELWIEKLKSFGFLTRSWQFSNKNNNIFAFSNRDLLTQRVHVYPRIFFLPPQKFPSISTSLFARCNTYPDRFRLSSILFLLYTSHKLAEYIIYEKFPTLSNIIALPIHSLEILLFRISAQIKLDRPSFSTNQRRIQHRARGINFPSGWPETLNYNHAPYVIPWRRINVSARRFG